MKLFKKIEAWLAYRISYVLAAIKLLYYRKVRLRHIMRYLDTEGEYIGPSCPHEVRIPMEAVRRLNELERSMLDDALLLGARPYGATLHICRRCYCLTRSTHRMTFLGT